MAAPPSLRTLGELQAQGDRPRGLRAELRANLLARLRAGQPLFPGILGYDDTVIPAVENALRSDASLSGAVLYARMSGVTDMAMRQISGGSDCVVEFQVSCRAYLN